MGRMTEEEVRKVQEIGEEEGIDNLGGAVSAVAEHMVCGEEELSMFDNLTLKQICPECIGHTVTVSCRKLRGMNRCKLEGKVGVGK